LSSNRILKRIIVPTIAKWKMRVTTTYSGVDEVVEKKRRIFVFYVPISIYNLLIRLPGLSLP
jgi:hypothetical protein